MTYFPKILRINATQTNLTKSRNSIPNAIPNIIVPPSILNSLFKVKTLPVVRRVRPRITAYLRTSIPDSLANHNNNSVTAAENRAMPAPTSMCRTTCRSLLSMENVLSLVFQRTRDFALESCFTRVHLIKG
jgi:hypothetical protein